MRLLKSHPLLKLVNSYIIDSPQPSNLSYLWNFGSLYEAPAFVSLPLHSSIIPGISTPKIFIMQKAFSDYIARLSFRYLYVLIKGSIKLRLIIYLVFILLICCDVNDETARSCVLLAVCGYYLYMVRNVKFNLWSWLYTLTSLSLALSIILTFWWLLSLALPILLPIILPFLTVIETSFLEDYKLSMNPDGGGDPGIGGSGGVDESSDSDGSSGSDGGSNSSGGPNRTHYSPWTKKKY